MELKLDVLWDVDLKWEHIDLQSFRTRDSVGLEINLDEPLSKDFVQTKFNARLSTARAVDNYVFHLYSAAEGVGARNIKEVKPEHERGIVFYAPKTWDVDEPGRRTLIITRNEIENAEHLAYTLEELEKRFFIATRGEWVNCCDYWHGFFGTSNNMWNGSFYDEGNPFEVAMQLAYELKQGIRKVDERGLWYFPGPIFPSKQRFWKEQIETVTEINKLLVNVGKNNIPGEKVAEQLENLAKQYSDVTRKYGEHQVPEIR